MVNNNMNILTQQIDQSRVTEDGKYIQGASHTCRVINHKLRNKAIIKTVCDLRKLPFGFDSIACSSGISGLIVVPQVAELLKKNIVIVRKSTDNCYSDFLIEGAPPFRYVIVDDLVCSGKTIRHIMNSIKEEIPRSVCLGVYCYMPEESAYRGDDGNKLFNRDFRVDYLNSYH